LDQVPGIRFDPTYKELKRSVFEVRIVPHLCFDPTYKELKPWTWSAEMGKYRERFDPTYKELKLKFAYI